MPLVIHRAYCPYRENRMTRKISPNNQNTVPVLDQDGKPLAPTRPSRARRWMETGKARKVWMKGHFAVQLTGPACGDVVPAMALNIDPGYRTTGLAVVIDQSDGTREVTDGFELKHRASVIVMQMLSRRASRHNRRGRLWRRPARFSNRERSEGWLPPSLRSALSSVLTTVNRLMRLYPVTVINLESCRFDPRLMHDPEVVGAEYQESERGRMQVREYVLQRDNRTCQYCGTRRGPMEVDHVVPESRGGGYRIDNLVASCRKCNQRKRNSGLEEFLYDDPNRASRIRRQLKQPLASATHLNRLMPLLREGLAATGLPVVEHDAVATAYTRGRLGVLKTHVNDAVCLGNPAAIMNLPKTVTKIAQVGQGNRQMLSTPSKHGTPRYKSGPSGRNSPYRAYCRLPRDRQGFTSMPGHKRRERRVMGITSGDLIRYDHPTDGRCQGYAVFINGNTRVRVSGRKSVKVERATLLARNNGYRQERIPNREVKHAK